MSTQYQALAETEPYSQQPGSIAWTRHDLPVGCGYRRYVRGVETESRGWTLSLRAEYQVTTEAERQAGLSSE